MEFERFTGDKSIKILQEFVEKYDKKVEADVREYAELLKSIEQYKETLKQLWKKEKQLEMLFDTFVSEEVYKKDCRHFDEIGAIRNTTNTKLQQCNNRLEINKEYYGLLKAKNFEKLWERSDFASQLAAIYYGFGMFDDNFFVTRILTTGRSELPFELWAYLNAKAIITSKNRCSLERLGNVKMGEPAEKIHTANERACIQTAIKSMNSIQKTKECQQEVEKCCQEMDAEIEEYESFIESYNAYEKSMQEQLRALGAEHFGRQYGQLVRETESWFKEATSAIGAEIVIRNDEIIKIKIKRPSVYNINELMQDRSSGLAEEELERTRNNLKHCRTDGTSRKKLSEAFDRLIAEFNARMEQIAEAKEAEIARRRKAAHDAAIKKEKRRALIKKIIPVAIALFVVAAAGLIFYLRYMTNTYYGTSFYLGNKYDYEEYVIADSAKKIAPNTFQDTDIKSIVIPASVEVVGEEAFLGCTLLESVEFQSSSISIGYNAFKNCGSLTEIRNSGNFAGLEDELADAVTNCCNLDMSEKYDNLYNESIEGIPLLNNQVQFMNLMDNRYISIDSTDEFYVDITKDRMYEVEIGEEVIDENGKRSVDFSFAMDRGIYKFQFKGTLQEGSFDDGTDIIRCVDNNMDEKLQELKDGDLTILSKILDGQIITAENEQITLSEDNITVLEYEVTEKGKTYIPMKIQVSHADKDISFMGTLVLDKDRIASVELKQDNAAYSDGSGGAQAQQKNPEEWSIYNSKGEVKEELYLIEQSIPEDAFEWGGNYYYIYEVGSKTWDDAKAFCKSLGGHLAYIKSPEEDEALYAYIGRNSVYFGATDVEEEGVWKWADGEPLEYTNWHPGEPNFTDEYSDYAQYYSGFRVGKWNDNGFGYMAEFLCEWE